MVHTCHIQHDFHQESTVGEPTQAGSIESFYINLDETPDSIKEFRVQRKVGCGEREYQVVVDEDSKEMQQANTFKQVSDRVYEAKLDNTTYQFQVPSEDLTSSINHPEVDWTSITKFSEGFVLGDTKGSIYVYDRHWQLQKVMEEAHVDEITSLQCFPSGTVLLSASDDMQIKLWSLLDGSNPRTFVGHTSAVTDTVLVGRGRNFLSSGLDGCIRLWECGSGKNIHTMTRKENPYDGVNSIILLDRVSEGDKKVHPEVAPSNNLEFETEGKQILAAHESGVITLHDLYTKRQEMQLPNEFMSACNVVVNNSKQNDNIIFAGYENGTVAQWDIRSPKHSLSHIKLEGALNPINTMSWFSTTTSNNLYVSAGIDSSIKISLGPGDALQQADYNQTIPQFLVLDDYRVSQYIAMKPVEIFQEDKSLTEETVIAVGNRGFVSIY